MMPSSSRKQYIRFVIPQKDFDSGHRMGLFQAMEGIRGRGGLTATDSDRAEKIYRWFFKNLNKPSSLKRSKRPDASNKALSWFKDSATEHISKMREYVSILEENGVVVEMIRTDRPGYIVYEDDFQITAEPFSDTGA